jgi:hypothetical protein
MSVLRNALDSSAVAGRVSRARQWLRVTRERMAVGLGERWSDQQERRELERVRTVMSTSRLARLLSSLVMAPVIASRQARVRRLLDPLVSQDLPAKIRTGSCAIVVAVLTHTVLLAVLGVPVQALGWSTRAALLAAGVIGLRWPGPFAAAWRDRQTRSR